jgi:hypothetical protein
VHRVAAGVLLLKGRSRPQGSRTNRRVGAGAEQGEEHHREHLHLAAFLDSPATTTSPTQREMNLSLALSRVVSIPLDLPMSAPSSRCAQSATGSP